MEFSKIEPLAELSIAGADEAIARSLASLGYGGPDVTALSRSEYGAQLITARDYCELGTSLLDDHRVFFESEIPCGLPDIIARLQRMVHAPQNPEVITAILKAASRIGPELGSTFSAAGRQARNRNRHKLVKSLPALASALARLQGSHPDFASALLTGRLREAITLLPNREHLVTVCEMTVLWSLHDLQMIAAKLHRSIWAACDGLLAPPGTKAMTIGSLIQPAREMLRMFDIARDLVKRGPRPMNAFEQREVNRGIKFIARHGLARQGRELLRSLTGMEPEAITDQSPLGGLLEFYERAGPLVEQYRADLKLFEAARVTVPGKIAIAQDALARGKANALQRVEEKELPRQPIAMAWYGMSPVEAMAYACVCFVKRMETVEKTIERASKAAGNGSPFVAPLDRNRLNNRQRETVNALMKVYRAGILRDPDHLSFKAPKVDDDGSVDDPPLCMEAKGRYWTCEHPLLPHPDRPLEINDIILGRGIALSDKIHELDAFDKKRLGRPAREAAEALIRRRPIDHRFDLALPARLGDAHS